MGTLTRPHQGFIAGSLIGTLGGLIGLGGAVCRRAFKNTQRYALNFTQGL